MENSLNVDKDIIDYDEICNKLRILSRNFKFFIIRFIMFPRFISEGTQLYNIIEEFFNYSSILCKADQSGEYDLTSELWICVNIIYLGINFLTEHLKYAFMIFNTYVLIHYTFLFYVIFRIVF